MSHAPFDSSFAHDIYVQKYAQPGEEWGSTAIRVVDNVMGAVDMHRTEEADRLTALVGHRKFIPAGRYLYASGRDLHQVQNCALYRAEDSREGWAELSYKIEMSLMTGAGIGVDYSALRPAGAPISRTGGFASGPISKARITNEVGREVMQGGARRSAIWAGLRWDHPDVFDFIRAKDWPEWMRKLKAGGDLDIPPNAPAWIQSLQESADFTFPAPLDMTNISVQLDRNFFEAYEGNLGHEMHDWAHRVYDLVIDKMLTTAEPGFSVDYDNPRESLRNACTEITSEDDSDICNLGSLNMAAFDSIQEFSHAVELSTLFLLAGTVYSHLPHEEVYATREKNRRLGLGVMGVHEWLLKRGKKYGPDAELGEWLEVYAQSTEAAHKWADKLGISRPIKTRAIAPNGTIGILAETTTSAEPIFAAAYKRRVRNASAKGDTVEFEYVVDPTAARLVEAGVDPSLIEDAYLLSYDVERRVAMQAWLQQYVDHGISSTVNLPAVGQQPFTHKEFGDMLIKYLPKLRGITAYPDGARGGQPLTSVPLEYALDKTGVRFEENEERCVGGACGV